MSDEYTELMTNLLAEIKELVVVDFPLHSNIGDNAIWVGQIELFKRIGKKVVKITDVAQQNFDYLLNNKKMGMIIHGGGNFGDFWSHHQKFREKITMRYPEHKIIQMPQSIHFQNAEAADESFSIFRNHSDFHLIVRDLPSYNISRSMGIDNCYLAPDSASLLSFGGSCVKGCIDILIVSREDKEKALTNSSLDDVLSRNENVKIQVTDWIDADVRLHEWLLKNSFRIQGEWSIFRNRIVDLALLKLGNSLAKKRLAAGIRLLERSRLIVTDRLHVVVLANLMGLKVFYVDNSYGKISNYVNQWLLRMVFKTRLPLAFEASYPA